MRLVYINHSGFAVEAEGFTLLFDYFKDSDDDPARGYAHRELLARQGPLYVFSSHFHSDHFNPEVLRWKERKADICYLFSRDILKRKRAGADEARYLRKGDTFADGRIKLTMCGSTDAGGSFLVEAGGKLIFHAGDLNNWHWERESTPREVARMEGAFLRELDDLARLAPRLDVAMFPVDPRMGGDFARGARQFIDRFEVGLFVPMHFWGRPDEVRPLGAYAGSRGAGFELPADPGQSCPL